jgi:hypothetical protein
MPMLLSRVAMITSQQPSRARCRRSSGPATMPTTGHLAVEPREAGEGGDVQAGDDGHVGVAGPAAAALGEQHRPAAGALSASPSRRSVFWWLRKPLRPAARSRRRRAPAAWLRSGGNIVPLMRPRPVTMPSAGVLRTRSSALRRPLCAATARAPYSLKLPSSHRSAMFSRARAQAEACRLATACGRARRAWGLAIETALQVGAAARRGADVRGGALHGPPRPGRLAAPAPQQFPSCTSSLANSARAPGAAGAAHSCSIFIASRISTTSPSRTRSPGRQPLDDWACRGARSPSWARLAVGARGGRSSGDTAESAA